jgi:hypothetical protein
MAMHIVLGDGEMTAKELAATLQDLWNATVKDEAFWFIVQGKSEPTSTDLALLKWLHSNEVYYEVLTDDADSLDDAYEGYQNLHTAKQLARKVVNLLESSPEEGESADLLLLYSSSDSSAEEDRWLNKVAQAAADGAYQSFVLNDGLMEVEIFTDGAEEEEEEEAPKKTGPSKKAPAKRPARQEPEEEEEEPEASKGSYTRDELEEMDLSELKKVASDLGITVPSRSRPKTYVDYILGEAASSTPEAEIEETTAPGLSIGGIPVSTEAVAEAAAAIVLRRIAMALQSD